MDIAESIRVALAKRNRSKAWLATAISKSRTYVSDLCNGKKIPSLTLIELISIKLDFKVSELIKFGENDDT